MEGPRAISSTQHTGKQGTDRSGRMPEASADVIGPCLLVMKLQDLTTFDNNLSTRLKVRVAVGKRPWTSAGPIHDARCQFRMLLAAVASAPNTSSAGQEVGEEDKL